MRHYVEPRSEQWHRLRLGRVTSTRMHTVAHGTMAAQTKLLDRMQWEMGNPDEAVEEAMQQFAERTPAAIALGREREEWAIARFEIKRQQQTGRKPKMDRPGFVEHDAIFRFGSSPDWLEESQLLRAGESKVRTDQQKHHYAIKRGLLPEDKAQCYTHMMCSGAKVLDYVSYCPEWEDPETNIAIVEVVYDQTYASYLYAELNRFLDHFRKGTRPAPATGLSGIPDFHEDD